LSSIPSRHLLHSLCLLSIGFELIQIHEGC
jgi:hypothetical protein